MSIVNEDEKVQLWKASYSDFGHSYEKKFAEFIVKVFFIHKLYKLQIIIITIYEYKIILNGINN